MKCATLYKLASNLIIVVGLAVLALPSSSAQSIELAAKVVGITDGDTITVLHDGTPQKIRLWGIDCPESRQPFGAKAGRFTGDLAFGKIVTLLVHNIDRYGRQVAEVILPDGRNLNHELVKAGYAWWFVRYARNDKELQQLETEARTAKRGLWAEGNPTAPWQFRRPPATRTVVP